MRAEEAASLLEPSLDPPVTKQSLGELDLNKIVTDPRLRHDLNFEHEIMFRPNTYGTRGVSKKREEDLYFEALAVELAFYINHQRSLILSSALERNCPLKGKRESHTSSNSRPRVPQMIIAIREVVKTLVPTDKWQTVDDQFDVDLRMQELEHGVCDIAGLVAWLGKLLLCSCSPMRDPVVTAMVTKTQEAISTQDAHQLVNSIKDLFGVLETMKLDVANHQIRYLRFYLLEDSIQYEQTQILSRIAAGWSISYERDWFETTHDCDEPEDRFSMFVNKVIDKVAARSSDLPLTFSADLDRLRALQHDFRLCHYHAACVATFRSTLRQLGRKDTLSDQSYAQIMQNIWAVIVGLGPLFEFGPHCAVTLQIVSEAFQVCDISALPDSNTLYYATLAFKDALDDTREVKSRVWNELARLVYLEADVIFDMSPLEILNRYDPGPAEPSDGPRKADLSLESVARRTAHVAVLHWRVWAPILYSQPAPGSDAPAESTNVTPAQEMSERPQTRISTSAVKASRPTIIPGQTPGPQSHSAATSQVSSRSPTPSYTAKFSDAERKFGE
ncbi:MAG: hypothetical protein Q9170_006903 [Blastenia crenularia]